MSDDTQKTFVNRHGHRVTGSLEGPPPLATTQPKASKPPKVSKVKKTRNKKSFKKIATPIVLVTICLFLVPLAGGELIRARYITSTETGKNQLIEFAASTAVSKQRKQTTLTELSAAAGRVEKIRDDVCDGGFTDNLAMIYPRAQEAYQGCISLKGKIVQIAAALRDMESQVRYLQALAPIIEPVAKNNDDGFAIISAQHENWRALNESLTRLSPAASQRASHEKLKAQSKAIFEAWSLLNTANNSQDGAAFVDAEKKLGETYEAFRAISADLSKVMNDTQTKLTTAYKTL
jgi:hypothetical protein